MAHHTFGYKHDTYFLTCHSFLFLNLEYQHFCVPKKQNFQNDLNDFEEFISRSDNVLHYLSHPMLTREHSSEIKVSLIKLIKIQIFIKNKLESNVQNM